jgi:isoleucyl-tRNA synthetase
VRVAGVVDRRKAATISIVIRACNSLTEIIQVFIDSLSFHYASDPYRHCLSEGDNFATPADFIEGYGEYGYGDDQIRGWSVSLFHLLPLPPRRMI